MARKLSPTSTALGNTLIVISNRPNAIFHYESPVMIVRYGKIINELLG